MPASLPRSPGNFVTPPPSLMALPHFLNWDFSQESWSYAGGQEELCPAHPKAPNRRPSFLLNHTWPEVTGIQESFSRPSPRVPLPDRRYKGCQAEGHCWAKYSQQQGSFHTHRGLALLCQRGHQTYWLLFPSLNLRSALALVTADRHWSPGAPGMVLTSASSLKAWLRPSCKRAA